MSSLLRSLITGLVFPIVTAQVQRPMPTVTTLSVSPSSSVPSGTIVTLTATVKNPGAVTKGTVLFCNASLSNCDSDDGLYGSAQLTSSGTASMRSRFFVGVNNIRAIFVPTSTSAGSSSPVVTLGVSADPIYASHTTLTSTGSPGNYNLIGTVTGFGSQGLTGTIQLRDLTNGDADLGTTSLGRPSWTLATPRNTSNVFTSSGLPVSVAVGDFDGDGRLDIATVNDDDNGWVAILLGNGDGSFQAPITYPVGVDPVFVTVGDFNGDGRPDLAVANSNSNNMSILFGNGDGTFQAPIVVATGVAPDSIAVGDFNADGQLDLAVSNLNTDNISILLGNGDGTFQAQVTYAAGSNPSSIKVGDFNGDGISDLVTANRSSNNLSVLIGKGDGTFQASTVYATGAYPAQVSVGDFNHDGNADLTTANADSNDVSVLLGNGDGTFRAQTLYGAGSFPASVAVADFDGDGNLDIATSSVADGGSIAILLGGGDGTFHSAVEYAANSGPDGPDSVAVGDFNGDGEIDLASAFGTSIRILLGEQVATFGLNGISIPGTGSQSILALYSGDGSRSASQSNIIALTGLTASMITLTSSQPLLLIGQTALLTANVTTGAAGLVSFTAGNIALGTVAIDSTGIAVLSTQFAGLSVGSYVVTAAYLGNSNYASSTASITEELSLNHSAVSLSSSSDPSSYGSLVSFTATLTSGATGIVTFTDGAVVIGTKTISGGAATVSISSLSAGNHAIAAVYSGDSNFARSTSSTLVQTVNKAAANMNLTSSANPSVYGSDLIFTATLNPGATGTVTFTDGTAVLGVASLDASGKATISGMSLPAGSHNITAIYSGDSNYF